MTGKSGFLVPSGQAGGGPQPPPLRQHRSLRVGPVHLVGRVVAALPGRVPGADEPLHVQARVDGQVPRGVHLRRRDSQTQVASVGG